MSEITIPSPNVAMISFDHQEVSMISAGLLKFMAEQGLDVSDAALGAVLSIGRLLSPKRLTEEQEEEFLEAMFQFLGFYFAERTERTVN